MKAILNHLFEYKTLSKDQAKQTLIGIGRGEYNPSQIASFLTVYMMRSLRVEELEGFRDAMLELCLPVDLSAYDPMDLCGTGGDGKDTFNISTLSSFVVAGAGQRVAKHGNHGVSSLVGSSTIMEHLGYRFTNDAGELQRKMETAGICFLHAPLFHPAMKNVGPVRKELGIRTIFNILGPLTNPADAPNILMGVFHPDLVGIQVRALQRLGAEHAVVVYGKDGMDEVSLGAATMVGELKNGEVREYEIHPEDFGLTMASNRALRVETPAESRVMLEAVLADEPGAARDIVILNAGAALYAADVAPTLADGVRRARAAIADRSARAKLDQYIAFAARQAKS